MYSAIPDDEDDDDDDDDYTETCWRIFYVNFNIPFKEFLCASVGNKTLIISRCTVQLWKKMKDLGGVRRL